MYENFSWFKISKCNISQTVSTIDELFQDYCWKNCDEQNEIYGYGLTKFFLKGKKQKGFKQLQSNKDTITRWATT